MRKIKRKRKDGRNDLKFVILATNPNCKDSLIPFSCQLGPVFLLCPFAVGDSHKKSIVQIPPASFHFPSPLSLLHP